MIWINLWSFGASADDADALLSRSDKIRVVEFTAFDAGSSAGVRMFDHDAPLLGPDLANHKRNSLSTTGLFPCHVLLNTRWF